MLHMHNAVPKIIRLCLTVARHKLKHLECIKHCVETIWLYNHSFFWCMLTCKSQTGHIQTTHKLHMQNAIPK